MLTTIEFAIGIEFPNVTIVSIVSKSRKPVNPYVGRSAKDTADDE
jgi:hypothetical protein